MAVTTNYGGTLSSPTSTLGFFIRPETKVWVGEARLWATGGLFAGGGATGRDWIYEIYEASIGLQSAVGIEVGALNALSFAYEPDRSPIEIINIADAPAYELVGEECTVSMELLEWNPDIISLVIGSGQYHTITANDALVRFGGGCAITSRPIVIEGVNASCYISDITDLDTGLRAFVLTLYDCLCTSGLSVDFTAAENAPIATEWQVLPVLILDGGNRLGNMYMYGAA